MDIEKLIEQLRYLADTPSYTAFHDAKEREIICDQCEADFCYDKQQDAHWCMYEALSRAATALSTLQAENARLREELEYEREHANAYHEECGQWEAENEKLRAELEQERDHRLHAEEYADLFLEDCKQLNVELEQVKRKRDAAVESIPHECKTCVYHTVFFNGCTPDHDCTNPDGGCSNNCDRWKWRGQKEG